MKRMTGLAGVLLLVLAACSSAATPAPTTGPTAPPASTSTSASPGGSTSSADALTPYPSKAGNLPTVKFAQSTPTTSFIAFIVAKEMNFFEYQGVKVQAVTLQGDATNLSALIGGTIDLSNDASASIAGAVDQGLDMQAIQNSLLPIAGMCVGKSWAQQHNVTTSSPIEAKVAALKGATVAITGPGAIGDRAARFLLTKYAGLNPDTDVTFTTMPYSSIPAAIDANQVQTSYLAPPGCEALKNGVPLIQASDVPAWKGSANIILYGKKSWLTANKDIAKATATAISMGSNFIIKHPDAALKLLQKNFSSYDPQIIATVFQNPILPAVTADGKFTSSMWQVLSDWFQSAGLIKKALPTAEGTIWTNEYIGDASVK